MRARTWMVGCCLLLATAAAAADLGQYAGNYVTPGGAVLAVAEFELSPDAPHVLAFTNLATGRFGVLAATDKPNEFALNATMMGGDPVARLVFDGRALTYRPTDGPDVRAERASTRSENITIHANGAEIGATLQLPAGNGPFPAVVLVPAGHLGRLAVATFPNFFLDRGFAVLAYDRRSERASFETYALDAVAAVHELKTRKSIDAKRIGLWGHSQGGWLSLVAASKSRDIAFVIDHSGMLVPAWQQELYRLSAEGLADGVAPEDVSAAVAYESEMMRVAETGKGWNELVAKRQAAGKAAWLDLVYKPESLAELQSVWANDFSFDPRPFARKVTQPVLALFGGLDRSTPIESAANLMNSRRGEKNVTVRFFPTADHAFLEAMTGGNAEIPTLTRFVPGMFQAMGEWLRGLQRRR